LGVLLAASLTTTIVLSERIAFVEVPGITPALAADILMPLPHQIAAAAALTLLLVSAAARRWSEPPRAYSAFGSWTWRRDERRYYHERRIFLLLLAGVLSMSLVRAIVCDYMGSLGAMLISTAYDWIPSAQVCLSAVLIVLAVQSAIFRWSKCDNDIPMAPPQLAPGLFVLIWLVLLAIIIAGVPILGAWGFALGFNVG
jgi:hypothetical protein